MRILGARIFFQVFWRENCGNLNRWYLQRVQVFQAPAVVLAGNLTNASEKTEEKLTAILSLTVSRFKKG